MGASPHTVYIADSLELRRTTFDGEDYGRDVWTEVPYLFAHGERLARVHYATDDVPTLTSGNLHVLLEVQDFLGSTAIVLDQATGELLEAGTYEAYGATESDYRPERWDSYREDYRFTGKEEDVEVGLECFGKRYYAPGLGRWVSADPLAVHGLGADANVYAYVHGATLRDVDPIGLSDGALGSSDNPIPTNQVPTNNEAVQPGQIFTLLPPSEASPKGGAQVFADAEAAKKAGGQSFYRYEPSSAFSWSDAKAINEIAHANDDIWNSIYEKIGLEPDSKPDPKPMTFGDLAQHVAHPLTPGDPSGKSGGMVGGHCPTCEGNELVQVVEAALQVWEAITKARRMLSTVSSVAGGVGRAMVDDEGGGSGSGPSMAPPAGPGSKPGSSGGPGAGRRFDDATKDAVEREAGGRCVFCGRETTHEPGPNQRHTDHSIPKSRGGNDSLDNAQNTCRTCNLAKGAKTTGEFIDGI